MKSHSKLRLRRGGPLRVAAGWFRDGGPLGRLRDICDSPGKSIPKRLRGITLIELLFVVAILATLVAIAVPNYRNSLKKSQVGMAISDISLLEKEIDLYFLEAGKFPDSLDDIGRGNFLDPWGRPYRYLNFANVKGKGKMRKDRFLVPLNTDYDLYSVGEDGETATPLTAAISQDDVVRANDGGFIGLGEDY